MKEGIRFSFSNSAEFVLGSRLSVLHILIKYASWIKRIPEDKLTISDLLHKKEIELKNNINKMQMKIFMKMIW
jgi:hypothetical protein